MDPLYSCYPLPFSLDAAAVEIELVGHDVLRPPSRRIIRSATKEIARPTPSLDGSGPMVPTRFVLKYRLRVRLEPSGAHEAVEGSTGHARELGDGGLGNAQLEEAPDVVLLATEP